MARIKYADWSEERKARKRAWQNTDVQKARKRDWRIKWRAANPERTRELARKAAIKRRVVDPERAKKYQVDWANANREHVKRYRRERFRKYPNIPRQYAYKRKYGMTIVEYEQMLAVQDGKCAICKADRPGGKGNWPIDHCSKTGKVRALLCNACNPGLGFFKHDIKLLQRAIDYLKEFNLSQSPETWLSLSL